MAVSSGRISAFFFSLIYFFIILESGFLRGISLFFSSLGSFLIGHTTFLPWLIGLEKACGQISCRSQPEKWSLQILRCMWVILLSFLILAILIYSVLVSREQINWAKTAAFSLNCLSRRGLLSIFSCKSLPSSLKSTRTLVAANKGDLKCASLSVNSVWNVTYLSVLHYTL